GLWTIPAGFMEVGETAEEGARREALEEASCDVVLDGLLAMYSLRHVSQVQLIFRGTLRTPDFAAGPESREVRLFAWNEIPWQEIAFPSVVWSLERHRAMRGVRELVPGG